jgi:HPt (histidine-containing phosphotransfer) domain-containing protein
MPLVPWTIGRKTWREAFLGPDQRIAAVRTARDVASRKENVMGAQQVDVGTDLVSEVVDLEQALGRVGGDRGFYQELLGMLLEDAPEQVREMEGAIHGGDAEQLMQTAHRLKGAAANLAAGPVRDVAMSLENMGRQGCLAGAETELARLEAELFRLQRFVETLG